MDGKLHGKACDGGEILWCNVLVLTYHDNSFSVLSKY
jgi:hypothetical protein